MTSPEAIKHNKLLFVMLPKNPRKLPMEGSKRELDYKMLFNCTTFTLNCLSGLSSAWHNIPTCTQIDSTN